jgi:hypothetical protein
MLPFALTQANIEFAMLVVSFFGITAFGIGKLLSGFRSGKADQETEADRALRIAREANSVFERRIKELEFQAKENMKAIAQLQGELKSANETAKQYLAILQMRDPKFESYMESSMTLLKAISENLTKLSDRPAVQINNTPTA